MPKQAKKPRSSPAPEAASRKANGDAENGGVENLDKVRDILFGSQMRDNERRFGRLEERVVKETIEVREESRKRLETLEAYVRKEVQSLMDRLKNEQTQRADGLKEVAAELKEFSKDFDKRAGELQEQIAESQSSLRQEILEQSKLLRDELRAVRTDGSTELESVAGELRAQKLDRAALADLFTEMAARVGEEA